MGDGNQCIAFCCFIIVLALIIGAIAGFDKIFYAILLIFGGLGG